MNNKHPETVKECVRRSLNDKVRILRVITEKIERWKNGEEQISGVTDQGEWLTRFTEKRSRLLVMFKENVISITMLAFFAQKDIFEPLVEIGCGNNKDEHCCWAKVIEYVQMCCGQRKSIDENENEQVERFWDSSLRNSVLFHIRHRSQMDLEKGLIQETKESGWITFSDIFSYRNQFMVVSKRENRSATWKQYLTPICSLQNEDTSIIQCLKKYSVMENNSDEKKKMEDRIIQMGKNALVLANTYGKDSNGRSGTMDPDEYFQQYFLRWLLRYIPTVALFMSNDGNTRINIIHGETLPFVFMDKPTKSLTLKRILEEADNYDIQRFSIPAWQGLENLSCRKLPYSHYFVKRGYMAEESYSKVIFPFEKEELDKINEMIHSDEVQRIINDLWRLRSLLNVRLQLVSILTESGEKIERLLENIQDDTRRRMVSDAYGMFMKNFRQGGHRAGMILDKVRTEYRSFVIRMLEQKNQETEFLLEDLEDVSQGWKDVYIWFLLRTICSNYMSIDIKEQDIGLEKEKVISLGKVWYYISENRYMKYGQNVLKYKRNYKEDIEQGLGIAYEKRERILAYIEKARSNVLRREHLQNCWICYVSEIFELFQSMEEEQYQVMEGLADWDAIKKALSRKERTNDTDN